VQECYVIFADFFYSIPQIKQHDIQEFYTLSSKCIFIKKLGIYLIATFIYSVLILMLHIYKYRIMGLSKVAKDYVCIIRVIV